MKVRSTTDGIACDANRPSSDAFAVRAWGQTVMAVLCDGAGSGDPAREAAQRAVNSLIENYHARPRSWEPLRALREFTELLNRNFYIESQARFERSEMVCTLVAVVIEGDRLFGVSLGDSPAWLHNSSGLQKLTTDHVEPERTHVLSRALGMSESVLVDEFTRELSDGDVVMLCSDGVSNTARSQFATLLAKRSSAHGIAIAAREAATEDTLDDISVIVLDVQQTGKLRSMTERNLAIPERLTKGQVIDGWTLVRSFQSTDRVWLAEKDKQRSVLKFAPVEAIESEAHLDAFTRETWNATRAHMEEFVHATEPIAQTMRYYVMEFVDAPSLHAVLRDRLLSVDSAIALGRFLAEAGHKLLRLELAHGDIKPENILCVGDYAKLSFKLVDLGSAAPPFSVSSRAGTASYLAPERFQGAPVSERTEIFAIGVTMYQALTGKLPFGEIERFQTPSFSLPKRVSSLNPNVPLWLDAIVARALSIHPARRHQHFTELAFELDHPLDVAAFHESDVPLLQRNPLAFYKTGFFLLLALSAWLALKLLRHP
jgi:serine/threonine protein phosphatase PrpC